MPWTNKFGSGVLASLTSVALLPIEWTCRGINNRVTANTLFLETLSLFVYSLLWHGFVDLHSSNLIKFCLKYPLRYIIRNISSIPLLPSWSFSQLWWFTSNKTPSGWKRMTDSLLTRIFPAVFQIKVIFRSLKNTFRSYNYYRLWCCSY